MSRRFHAPTRADESSAETCSITVISRWLFVSRSKMSSSLMTLPG